MGFKKILKKFSYKNYSADSANLIKLDQEQIDAVQQILLGICDDIFTLCQEKNYVCFLGGGTALGAIRHHGFIPWDDDVDLNMTRESYKKFIPEFRKRYGDKYWIHTPEDNPEYGIGICRICKKGTKLKERIDLYDDSESGVPVDIFIVENVYNNKILRTIQGLLSVGVKACVACRLFYRDRKKLNEALGDSKEAKSTARFRSTIGFFCSFMSVEKWTKLSTKIYSMCKNNRSKYVSIPQGRWAFFGSIHKRSSFCTMKTMSFEGRQYNVCKGIDGYMRQHYGDNYMQVPPPEKREAHLVWEIDLGDKRGE